MKSAADKLKELFQRHYGKDSFEAALAAGFAAKLDAEVLAKKHEIPYSVLQEHKARFDSELEELEAHSAVAEELREQYTKIFLAVMSVELQESLLSDLRDGNLSAKDKAGLLQFLCKRQKHEAAPAKKDDSLTPEERAERIRRLTKEIRGKRSDTERCSGDGAG